MARTFVEVSSFGALEAQLGHGADAARLAQDYLQQFASAGLTRPRTGPAFELPLCPPPFGLARARG